MFDVSKIYESGELDNYPTADDKIITSEELSDDQIFERVADRGINDVQISD